jgi:hypothetical protein
MAGLQPHCHYFFENTLCIREQSVTAMLATFTTVGPAPAFLGMRHARAGTNVPRSGRMAMRIRAEDAEKQSAAKASAATLRYGVSVVMW